jgi:hypothetical protein
MPSTGLAHITLANSIDKTYIYGGENGLIFMADAATVSVKDHPTTFPFNFET